MSTKFNTTAVSLRMALMFASPLILATPAYAEDAEESIELVMANDADGHVYLTREPCDVSTNTPDASNLYRAYSVALEGTDQEKTFEGCWMSPELDLSTVPAEYVHKAERVVIIYAENGMQFNQLLSDFVPNTPNTGTMVGQF